MTFAQAYNPAAHMVKDKRSFGALFTGELFGRYRCVSGGPGVVLEARNRFQAQIAEWSELLQSVRISVGLRLEVVLTTQDLPGTMEKYLAAGVPATVSLPLYPFSSVRPTVTVSPLLTPLSFFPSLLPYSFIPCTAPSSRHRGSK